MWNSDGFYDKILEGWEKSETTDGVPYYINHKTEQTEWDHPVLVKIFEEFGDLDCVRYAAYRTALKLRFIQKRLHLDLVELRVIASIFDRDSLETGGNPEINCEGLYNLLLEIYNLSGVATSHKADPHQLAELLLNWLLNMYDANRSGCIKVLSVKIGLAALSSARLLEKYRYIFQQAVDSTLHLSRKTLAALLFDLIQIPHLMNEGLAFGGLNVGPAVESCFQGAWGTVGVAEDVFNSWLLQEPQTVVWLPTLHRLSAAETVKHEAKCNICKVYPIIGFRYKCLKCFNYDLCQQCFFTGRTSKNHKLKHPTQEYCITSSQKEDTKAFLKTIRNNLSRKHRNKKKLRYLPIYGTQQPFNPQELEEELDEINAEDVENREVQPNPPERIPSASLKLVSDMVDHTPDTAVPRNEIVFPSAQRKELERVIQHMDQQNRALIAQLDKLQRGRDRWLSEAEDRDSDSDEQRECKEVEMEILRAHNKELEMQLHRLRLLFRQDDKSRQPLSSMITNIPVKQQQYPPKVVNIPPEPSPTTPYYRNPPPFEIDRSQSPPHYLLSDSMQVVPGSYPSPVRPLSSPLYPPASGAYPQSPRHKGQKVMNNPHPARPGYISTPYEPTPLPNRALSDTLDRLAAMDLTSASVGPISQTHLTLPSPENSHLYPEEEARMQELIEKMNKVYPANMTHSVLDAEDTLDEQYLLGHKIGGLCSDTVKNRLHITDEQSLMALADELGLGEIDSADAADETSENAQNNLRSQNLSFI